MPDDDDTIRVPIARPARRGRATRRWAMVGGGALLLGSAGAWLARGPGPLPALPAALAPPAGPPLLDQAAIAAHRATRPTALRWSANPLVWVLDFPTLELQGVAMNRAAALIEKRNTPRDRVLDDADLAAAIASDRRTAADWYYGHNYRAADLRRMFALAAAQGVALNPLELWLREQVELSALLDRGRDAAFLSIPAAGPALDQAMRASILMHELGHGQFFTLPFFAAHVLRVWQDGFTGSERLDVRRFLGSEGYDVDKEEVMANEALAYLLYTPDRRFFDPARDLGWSDAQVARLRAMLREGAPEEP